MKKLICVVVLAFISKDAFAGVPPTFNSAAEARESIPKSLTILSQTPSSQLLRKVFYECMRIPEDRSSSTWSSDRDFKLLSLCGLLSIMDALQDPKFDPNHPGAFLTAAAPPNSGIMPGEDPADVKDPALKTEYIQMINNNNSNILRSNLQNDLIRIKKECTHYTERYLKSRYSALELNSNLKDMIEKAFKNDPKSTDIIAQLTSNMRT